MSCPAVQSPLVSSLAQLRQLDRLADVRLVCGDSTTLPCHTLFLAAVSEFLVTLLSEVPGEDDKPQVIILPDFSRSEVNSFLQLLYTGNSGACGTVEKLLSTLGVSSPQGAPNLEKVANSHHENLEESVGDGVKTEPTLEELGNWGNLLCQDEENFLEKTEHDADTTEHKTKSSRRGLKRQAADTEYKSSSRGRGNTRRRVAKKPRRETTDIEECGSADRPGKQFSSTFYSRDMPDPYTHEVKCEWCNLSFVYFKLLKHIDLMHPDQYETVLGKMKDESSIRCGECGEGMLNKTDLTKHLKQVHRLVLRLQGTKQKPGKKGETMGRPHLDLKCDECGIRFLNRDFLADHMNRKHVLQPGEFAYTCDKCGKKSNATRAFKNHLNLHLPKQSLCNKCGETFPSVFDLRVHNRIHVKERMRGRERPKKEKTADGETAEESVERVHVCHICARKYSNVNCLNSHLKNVHRAEEDQFSCEKCSKRFNTKRSLSVHLLLHEEPRLLCPSCPKRFHTSLYLKGHILRSHTPWEELPYRCEMCKKGFADKETLAGHMNMHAGLTPYQCRYCPKGYQNQSNKLAHEKKSHPDLFTKIRVGLAGVRVEKRQNGEVEVTEEDLKIHPYQFNWR